MSRTGSICAALLVAGCGSSLVCKTATCDKNAKTYQACAGIASANYNFGGMSCSCSATASTCQQCALQIANWCGDTAGGGAGGSGGGGAGGSGGGGAGGSGGGPGSQQCSVTLSGAVTGTFPCIAMATYTTSKDETAFVIEVTNPSPLSYISIAMTRPGNATGSVTFSNSDAGEQAGLTVTQSGGTMPSWVAAKNTGNPDQGTYMASTTLSAGTATGDGELYNATGTLSASLVAVNGTGASGTVNLAASF